MSMKRIAVLVSWAILSMSICIEGPVYSQTVYPTSIPGLPESFFIDIGQDVDTRRLNRRTVASDFDTGRTVSVGGGDRAYQGDNIPIVGDFDGDGYDDIGVKWVGGEHEGKWTISLNDGTGNFRRGRVVTVDGNDRAYQGDNVPIVGDFNRDGFDDIGVKWVGGEHEGKWTISLNDGSANFRRGQVITIDGNDRAYQGDNVPIVGDFNNDDLDDIGVKWVGGEHNGRWTISLNNGSYRFGGGRIVTIGGSDRAYRGNNIPIVGDFNGDGFDDIGVKWVGGRDDGRWSISLNDQEENFGGERGVTFGGSDRAYRGDNVPIAGDFDGDGFDDAGVKWVGGEHNAKWVVSSNLNKENITNGRISFHMPVVFVRFAGQPEITRGEATAILDSVKSYFDAASYGRFNFDFRFKTISLPHSVYWTAGLPDPQYGADGRLVNGRDYSGDVRSYPGYECRFPFPANSPIVGKFNRDAFDDIGVTWRRGTSEENKAGIWTISYHDGRSDFRSGHGVTFAGSDRAYEGDNIPIVGDFDRDGLDDVGVKWVGGEHEGKWTISLNDGSGNFIEGRVVTIDGSDRAYQGDNTPIVGDFDGDGYDDIGVKWVGGEHEGKWTISLNDGSGNFIGGRVVTIGGSDRAYQGDNVPIVGDFNNDGHDDIGVKWVGGEHEGKWVISMNDRSGNFLRGEVVTIDRGDRAYKGKNIPIVGDFDGDGFDDIGVKWVGDGHNGHWAVSLNDRSANFGRGRIVSIGDSDRGYAAESVIFRNVNGDLRWPQDNRNVFRNYCQVAERNYAKDALGEWLRTDRDEYNDVMNWASTGATGPLIAYIGRDLHSGGVRYFASSWVGGAWPLTVGDFTFTTYTYQVFGIRTLSHELGHLLGPRDYYYHPAGNECSSSKIEGYLSSYDIMGYSGDLASFCAVNRLRFGFTRVRYITKQETPVRVTLPQSLSRTHSENTIVVIQPDPSGHPDELFVLENRRRLAVPADGGTFYINNVRPGGLYIYHVNASAPTTSAPLIDLENDGSLCPGQLRPHQGEFSSISSPNSRFYDGGSSKLRISDIRILSDDSISLLISSER